MNDKKSRDLLSRRHRSQSVGMGLVKELDAHVFSLVKKEVAERKRPSFKISQKLEKDNKNSDYLLKRAFILAFEENLVTEPLEDLKNFFSLGNKSIDGYRLRATLLLKRYEWMNACGDLLNLTQLFKRKNPVHTYITKRCYKPVTCSICSEKFSFTDEAKVCIHCKISLHDGICREKHEKSLLAEIYYLRGISRYHLEDYEKACRDMTKAIGLCDDERMKIVFGGDRGLVYFYMGRLEESLVDLETALAQNPTHEYYPRMIAAAYFRLNKFPEAKSAFSRAQEISPSLKNITPEEFFPYDLPEKILQEVFYHLSIKDRIQFVCTCRKWYGILLRLRQVFQRTASEGTRSPVRRRSRRSTCNNNRIRHSRTHSDDFSSKSPQTTTLDFNKSPRTPPKESPRSGPGSGSSPGSPTEEGKSRDIMFPRENDARRSKTMWNMEEKSPSPCNRKSRMLIKGDEGGKGDVGKSTGDDVEKPPVENGVNNVFVLSVTDLQMSSSETDKKKMVRRTSKTPRDDKTTDMAGTRQSMETLPQFHQLDSDPSSDFEVDSSMSPTTKRKVISRLRFNSKNNSPKVRRTKTRDGLVKPRLRVESEPEAKTKFSEEKGGVGVFLG